jgi:hypothetical protein
LDINRLKINITKKEEIMQKKPKKEALYNKTIHFSLKENYSIYRNIYMNA